MITRMRIFLAGFRAGGGDISFLSIDWNAFREVGLPGKRACALINCYNVISSASGRGRSFRVIPEPSAQGQERHHQNCNPAESVAYSF